MKSISQGHTAALLLFTTLLTGCFKTPTEHTWQLAGEKVWNIDVVVVQAMDNYSYEVVDEKTYTDVGTLQFTGTQDDCTYHLDAEIPLYNNVMGPISGICEFSSSKFFFRDPISTQYPLFGADIIKLNRSEMILFSGISLSVVYDAPYFFQFHFTCSKK